ESLFYYNEKQISKDIQNYIFAVNFEPGIVEKCNYTGDKVDISEEFYSNIEEKLIGTIADTTIRKNYRKATQKEYTAKTLTQEIMVDGKPLTATKLYNDMHERYVYNLKEKVLEPFLENENFRRAIKDFKTDDFKTYDKKIRKDVTFMINNLAKKYKYTLVTAQEICIYVIDNNLAKEFVSK
ncbi:MAG: serine protein kinase PrkA, partial [bacterium]|nr:serine protein kinase PrkA [bacterium]